MILLWVWVLGFQVEPLTEAAVVEAFAKLSRFQVVFQQETYSDFFDETLASGVLSVSRPGKMRMAYQKGERKLIIWDGSVCYEYDALADVESRRDQKELSREPLVQLLLYGANLKDFFLIDRFANGEQEIFRLRPHKEDGYHIEVVFNSLRLPVVVEVVGEDGEGTRFQFEEFQLDPDFDDFAFAIPEQGLPNVSQKR